MVAGTLNKYRSQLYIIGNGFDLYHGIASTYRTFEKYVAKNNQALYKHLRKYFDYNFLWCQFESTLAEIDMELVKEECRKYIANLDSDDLIKRGWHAYAEEICQRLDLVTVELREAFLNWILDLKIPDCPTVKLLNLNSRGLFLNFNYTATLQKLYCIKPENINYIHKQAIDICSEIVLGHGVDPNKRFKHCNAYNEYSYYYFYELGNEEIDEYYYKTFKPTAQIIKEQEDYFSTLKNICEVFVLGHSLSFVDQPYFEKIASSICKNSFWTVSYHNFEDIAKHKSFLNKIGIADDNLSLIRLKNMKKNYLQGNPTLRSTCTL
ncbi:Bacteriophage abortive infection AbiH [Parapedobacter koreensis]|uniref:Bacteriophage abortive infection AbiH n=2 Tax=Parapedobacter koreensis TaxID=332977 RepID=A0A1H7REY2_9SPHI|nr:Bacteriophage abortive infection AbiH [Parapedobacter koreensis]